MQSTSVWIQLLIMDAALVGLRPLEAAEQAQGFFCGSSRQCICATLTAPALLSPQVLQLLLVGTAGASKARQYLSQSCHFMALMAARPPSLFCQKA